LPAEGSARSGRALRQPCDQGERRPASKIFDIFEGTEQIQQLLIARAVTGLRVG
jgi:hypothetical protein